MQNAWITEFGLYRLITMNRQNNQGGNLDFHLSSNSQARDSEAESKAFRPESGLWGEMAEESWDLFSLGMIGKKVLVHQSSDSDWSKWNEWVDKSISRDSFKNCIESISALPGVGDLTEFGIKNDLSTSHITGNSDELRLRKEKEWEFEQKETSLSFKRKMTGLIGILFLMGFLLKASYLFFSRVYGLNISWREQPTVISSDLVYGLERFGELFRLNMTVKELGAVTLSVIGEKKTIYLSFHSGSLKD